MKILHVLLLFALVGCQPNRVMQAYYRHNHEGDLMRLSKILSYDEFKLLFDYTTSGSDTRIRPYLTYNRLLNLAKEQANRVAMKDSSFLIDVSQTAQQKIFKITSSHQMHVYVLLDDFLHINSFKIKKDEQNIIDLSEYDFKNVCFDIKNGMGTAGMRFKCSLE